VRKGSINKEEKQKARKETKEFYYLGTMEATGYANEFTMPNTSITAVEIGWKLDNAVREDIYQYIICPMDIEES